MTKTFDEFVTEQEIDLDDFHFYDEEAFRVYYSNVTGPHYWEGSDWDNFYDSFVDEYHGEYGDGPEFAERMIGEIYDVKQLPSILSINIDWLAVWGDLRSDGYSESGGYFFRHTC